MVRLTDHLNMTIAVDWDVKPTAYMFVLWNIVCTLVHFLLQTIWIHRTSLIRVHGICLHGEST